MEKKMVAKVAEMLYKIAQFCYRASGLPSVPKRVTSCFYYSNNSFVTHDVGKLVLT